MRFQRMYQLTLSALFLAVALVLPFLTGQLGQLGSMLLPMHIPVLLCGFICGWQSGLMVGLIAPLLRSVLFGMPPLMPTAIAMTFELAAYGALAGLLYARLAHRPLRVCLALLGSLLSGRIVWGLVSFALYWLFLGKAFTMQMFLGGALLQAWPGIVAQLVLIPLIVLALERARLIPLPKQAGR